jgi:hypothetical protein
MASRECWCKVVYADLLQFLDAERIKFIRSQRTIQAQALGANEPEWMLQSGGASNGSWLVMQVLQG